MFKDLFREKKPAILERWFKLVIETYPADGARLLGREKDQFANPVGSTIFREIERLYDELFQEMDPAKIFSFLDPIIRIRAVQDFSPSQAVGFILLLKEAIRAELGNEIKGQEDFEYLSAVESRIDKMTLAAFDIYMGCREKIHQIRTREIKDRSHLLMERMNRMEGEQDDALQDEKS